MDVPTGLWSYLSFLVQDTLTDAGELVPRPGGRGLAPNHHPSCYADDDALAASVRLHAHIAVDHLFGVADVNRPLVVG